MSKIPSVDAEKLGLEYVDWEVVSLEFARRVLTPRVLSRAIESYVPYPGQPKDDVQRCAAVRAAMCCETLQTVWIFRPELGLCRVVACEDWTCEPAIGEVLPSREGLHCLGLDGAVTPPGSCMDPEDYIETVEGYGRAGWSFEEPEPNRSFDELCSMKEDEVDDIWKPMFRAAKDKKSKMENLPSINRPGVPSLTLRFLLRCETDGETPQAPIAKELETALQSGGGKGRKGEGKGHGKVFKSIVAKCVSIDDVIRIEKPPRNDDVDDEDEEEGEVEWKSAATFRCKSVEDGVSTFMRFFPHQRCEKTLCGWNVQLVSFLSNDTA